MSKLGSRLPSTWQMRLENEMFLELLWLTLHRINILPLGFHVLSMERIDENKPWNIKMDRDH